MKSTKRILAFVCTVLMGVALTACGLLGEGEPEIDPEEAIAQTVAALQALASPTSPPTDTPIPPTAAPTETPTVAHLMQPGEPQGVSASLQDISSAPLAAENRAIGDNYMVNVYERPFTTPDMSYVGYVDLIYAEVYFSDPWVYVTMELAEALPVDASSVYAVELDLDQDGRGDKLITARVPAETFWTSEGVLVYLDSNGDVGGQAPLVAEEPGVGLDGYDLKIFDGGYGDDPDLAWIRRAPGNPNRVQIAFKGSLLDGATQYLWSVWAEGDLSRVEKFDYNDHFSLLEAGEPIKDSEYYPVQKLSVLDSTCRAAYGFTATGQEPGVCTGASVEEGGEGGATGGGPEKKGFTICITIGSTQSCSCVALPSCDGVILQPCTPCELPQMPIP